MSRGAWCANSAGGLFTKYIHFIITRAAPHRSLAQGVQYLPGPLDPSAAAGG